MNGTPWCMCVGPVTQKGLVPLRSKKTNSLSTA
jgi:hypothetical protein